MVLKLSFRHMGFKKDISYKDEGDLLVNDSPF